MTEPTFTDTKAEDLMAEAFKLSESDLWTFYDDDKSIAWDVPESYHGHLKAIYEQAGWEGCYHERGTVLHLNVKIYGSEAYRGFHETIESSPYGDDAMPRLEDLAQTRQDWDLETWWEDVQDFIRYDLKNTTTKVYQCGRMGGYLNLTNYNSPETVIRVAQFAINARDYYRSREYGIWLALETLDEYKAIRMEELASPRAERIEA